MTLHVDTTWYFDNCDKSYFDDFIRRCVFVFSQQEPLTGDVGVVDQEHSVSDAAKASHQPDVQSASEFFHFEAYTSAELAKATNNFSPETVIGEGKIGKVYIGTLRKMPVAIKMLHPHSIQVLGALLYVPDSSWSPSASSE